MAHSPSGLGKGVGLGFRHLFITGDRPDKSHGGAVLRVLEKTASGPFQEAGALHQPGCFLPGDRWQSKGPLKRPLRNAPERSNRKPCRL